VLKSYFESHVSDFQSEAQVSYEYLRLTPEKFKRDVVVTDEDIALYLSENEARFSNPARAKVRHIQFLYPKDSTAEQQKTTKERAEAALKRAKAGESFESLVLELSDDITTKMIGGDIGWVDSSSADKDVAAKIFALRGSGIAELAETSSGFRVLKVDEYQAPTVKELSEVRGEIEEAIRAAEASGYLGSRSLELYEEFRSDKTSLADIGVRYEVPVAKSASLINAATDPSEEVKGLTAQILENAPDTLLRIERPDAIILVKVSEYQEVRVPPFDEIKSRVAKVIKEQQAQKRAEEIARDLIQKVSNGSDLSVVAQEQTLKVETKEKMLRSAPVAVPFASEDAKRDLFAELKQGAVVAKPLQAVGGGYLVVQVSAVVPPTAEDLKKKLGSFREQASSSVGNTLTTAFINQLKSKSKIDFDPSILGG
jgi:peptidyl-prolyl cis-trans isomerase D